MKYINSSSKKKWQSTERPLARSTVLVPVVLLFAIDGMGPTTLNSQSQSCHGDQSFALLQVAKEERSEREGEKTNLPLPMQGRETLPAYISNSGYHKYLCVCIYIVLISQYIRAEKQKSFRRDKRSSLLAGRRDSLPVRSPDVHVTRPWTSVRRLCYAAKSDQATHVEWNIFLKGYKHIH